MQIVIVEKYGFCFAINLSWKRSFLALSLLTSSVFGKTVCGAKVNLRNSLFLKNTQPGRKICKHTKKKRKKKATDAFEHLKIKLVALSDVTEGEKQQRHSSARQSSFTCTMGGA